MNTLGMIGGLSWHSTTEYYNYINQTVNDYFGNNTNPPLLVINSNQRQIHEWQKLGRWDLIATTLTQSALILQKAGAQAIVFCSNTPHKAFYKVTEQLDIPVLHIADSIGNKIKADKIKKVGLIGTIYTMEEDFISERLKRKFDSEVIVPSDKSTRDKLQEIIENELAFGILKVESKEYILEQLRLLIALGAEGLVLGCTEFPLIIQQSDFIIPVYNSTYLHAMMGVDFILHGNKV